MTEAGRTDQYSGFKSGGSWRKTVAFLNTSLGIFLLTTVAVSGGTSLYTWIQSVLEHHKKVTGERERIDMEITHHFESLKIMLELKGLPGAHPRSLLEDVVGSLTGEKDNYFVIFPEYQDRSIHSLMINIAFLEDNEIDKKRIHELGLEFVKFLGEIIAMRDKINNRLLNANNLPNITAANNANDKIMNENERIKAMNVFNRNFLDQAHAQEQRWEVEKDEIVQNIREKLKKIKKSFSVNDCKRWQFMF